MDIRCDHYWLCRRGGQCPYCKDVFPGNYGASKFDQQLVAAKTYARVTGWKRVTDAVGPVLSQVVLEDASPDRWRMLAAWADGLDCDVLTLELFEGQGFASAMARVTRKSEPNGSLQLQLPDGAVSFDHFLQWWAESAA